MPSETFFHLSEEKKNRLINAAKEEFSKHLLENVSINQIIKRASISRGSFYTYFKDKEDLYIYLLKIHKKKIDLEIIKQLKQYNGDFIKAFRQIYNHILTFCDKNKDINFYKNMFLNFHFTNKKLKIEQIFEEETPLFQSHINSNLYKEMSKEEQMEAFYFTLLITNMAITRTFLRSEKREEEAKSFERKLSYLEYGIYKKEENQYENTI